VRRLMRHAARVLLTGIVGVSGLARAQQVPAPVPPVAVPTVPVPAAVNEIALPPLVPPIPLSRLSPEERSAGAGPLIREPAPAAFASDKARAGVDLLAAPDVPSSWAADPVKKPAQALKPIEKAPSAGTAPAAPRRAPVELTATFAAGSPWAAAPGSRIRGITSPAAGAQSAKTTALDVASVPKAAPKKNAVPWAVQRAPIPGKSRDWPAAFTERDRHVAPEMKPVALQEPDKSAAPPAVVGPTVPAELHQKVARECGGLAKDLKVVVRPDHDIVVQVRPVNRNAERVLIDRLLKLPEMTAPNVHLEIELAP
jgi:hypothetical protein